MAATIFVDVTEGETTLEVGEVVRLNLEFIEDPAGDVLEANATTPRSHGAAMPEEPWTMWLQFGTAIALYRPKRPVVGLMRLAGRFIADATDRGGYGQPARIVSSEDGSGTRRVGIVFEQREPRAEFLPGSIAHHDGQLWVMDLELPVVRTVGKRGSDWVVEEKQLDLEVGLWEISANRREKLLVEHGRIRRYAEHFPILADIPFIQMRVAEVGPVGVLERTVSTDPGNVWKLHLAEGGWVPVDPPGMFDEFVDMFALEDGFAVLTKSPAKLTFIGEDGRRQGDPVTVESDEPFTHACAVSPDRKTIILNDHVIRDGGEP